MQAPLSGLRVLDLTRLLPGPFLTQILAELGADVIKVEEPGVGDYARWIGPEIDGHGYAFAAVNRGKRSIAVDLKKSGAAAVILRLAARADVMLESFRPGVLDRLGLSDAVLAEANPRLVRVSLVGYGPGPMRNEPGHDLNYQSMAGILGVQGDASSPALGAVPIADLAGALYGAVGLLAALRERDRTGNGQRIEVALGDAALAFHGLNLARAAAGPSPARGAWELSGGLACYRAYRCRDGQFVALGALEPKFWTLFAAASQRPDLEDRHLDATAQMHAIMETLFLTDDAPGWVTRLTRAGVPATPVLSPLDALRHAQHARFEGRPGPAAPLTGRPCKGAVPALGADAESVLRDAQFTDMEIQALQRAGVVG